MSTLIEAHPSTANRILNSLTRSEYERMTPHLEPVNLWLGEVLCRPDEPITHVYFPNRGTVSIVSVFEDGGSVEVGMVGNEGMFGVCVFLGNPRTVVPADTGSRWFLNIRGEPRRKQPWRPPSLFTQAEEIRQSGAFRQSA